MNETGSWPSHSTDPNCPRGRLTGLLSNHVTLYRGVNKISQRSMLVNQISLINFQNADQILIHFRARFVKSHSQFKIISMEISPRWNTKSLNSGNLMSHWSMNWTQFKDPISHVSCWCCGGILVQVAFHVVCKRLMRMWLVAHQNYFI